MPFVHCSASRRLAVVDWPTVEKEEPRYVSLPYLQGGAEREFQAVRVNAADAFGPALDGVCRSAGAQTILLLDLLSRSGPRRAAEMVESLRAATGDRYPIYLGGVIEAACARWLRPSRDTDLYAAAVLESPGPATPDGRNDPMVLSCRPGAGRRPDERLTRALQELGVVDAIELSRPVREAGAAHRWSTPWVIEVGPDSHGDSLREAVLGRVQSLGCNRMHVSGEVLRGPVWPDPQAFLSWLAELMGQASSLEVRVQVPLACLDSGFLTELRSLGVRACEMQVPPPALMGQDRERILEAVDACLENHMAGTIPGPWAREIDSWPQVREMWWMCDRLGLDFLEMLGAVPAGGRDGWCGDLCRLLSRAPSLLFEYGVVRRLAQLGEHLPSPAGRLHSTIPTFHRVRLEQTRDWILGRLSEYGVRRGGKEAMEKACAVATAELRDIAGDMGETGVLSGPVPAAAPRVCPAPPRCDTAVIIPVRNERSQLRLCLHSLYQHAGRPYDVLLVDGGDIPLVAADIPCRGRARYQRLPAGGLRSLAVACGLVKAWAYEYVLLLSPNTCVLADHWLDTLIQELEENPHVGAVGAFGKELHYQDTRNTALIELYNLVSSVPWREELGAAAGVTTEDLMQRLTMEKKSCFVELTGCAQLYRGRVLRRIGLPRVEDRRLKHSHWDSELSMRVIGCGSELKESRMMREKLMHFGDIYYSRIPDVSYYMRGVDQIRKWLADSGHEEWASWLEVDPDEDQIVAPSYYDGLD